MTTDMSKIMQLNMTPLLQKIKNDLDRWKLLNLTLMGKINTIKMVIAPKFNYISMMIPVTIPDEIFKQYNQIIKDYLWNGKKPRINMQKLYEPRRKGGLALPNVELYNIAFEMAKLSKHWADCGSLLGWTQIEKEITAPFKPIEILSQTAASNLDSLESNFILQHSRAIWAKLHKMLGMSQYRQEYASIWNNPCIKIDKRPFLWKSWLCGNLNRIGDLYKDGVFMSFQELGQRFKQIERGDFWRYLQLRSSVRALDIKPGEGDNVIRGFFELPGSTRSASVLYNLIVDGQ